jgi:hypothetical protein
VPGVSVCRAGDRKWAAGNDALFALKDWLSPEKLGKDAANRPDVDRRRVAPVGEHDLGRAVPARGDVLGQRRAGSGVGAEPVGVEAPREAKVADLELQKRSDGCWVSNNLP